MNNVQRWGRGAVALAAMGGAALISSGCVSLDNVGAGQAEVVGNVNITGVVCLSGSTGCGNVDNIDIAGVGSATNAQLMLGYRVSASLTPPAAPTSDAPSVTFSLSPSYAAELERRSPAGAGRKWVGYISNDFAHNGAVDPDLAVASSWGLPQAADGAPFAGPVVYRPVVGFRLSSATLPVTRPVVCDGATLGASSDTDSTICVDSPLLATLADPDLTRTTRDLGILTGATATGQSGTTITVPFTARYAGSSSSSANFALSATTAVPGGTVVVTPGSLLPATDSTNPVNVAVTVPAGTAPGTYDVTLTATLGTQTRVRTGTVAVTSPPIIAPPPLTPPVTPAALRLTGTLPSRLAFLTARSRGVRVIVRSNRAGRAVVRLFQGPRRTALATRTVSLRNGTTTVLLRSRLVKAGAYRVTVTFVPTGRVTTLRGTLRVR